MSRLIKVLLVTILIAYIYAYLKTNPQFQILQTSISKIQPRHLFEKSPIIIEEPIVNPLDMVKTTFKYLYIRKKTKMINRFDVLTQNKSRFVILTPKQGGAYIQISHPSNTNAIKNMASAKDSKSIRPPLVDIKLSPNQVIVLPPYWWYKVESSSQIQLIELDDMLSILFKHFT
jgi:hypothetical protein